MSLARHHFSNPDRLESQIIREEERSLPMAICKATSFEKSADLMLYVINAKRRALALVDSREKMFDFVCDRSFSSTGSD